MRIFYALFLLGAAAATAQAAPPAKIAGNRPSRVSSVATPKVLPASDVTDTGFTANWEAVPGADGYALFVYSREEVTSPGEYCLLYEHFNLISQGSVIEPVFIDDAVTSLSDASLTVTPDWTVMQCILAGGKVGGVIWTPYLDLRADNGRYTVSMTIQGYAGQEIMVTSVGTTEVQKKYLLTDNGANLVEMEFDNGNRETYLRIVDNGFPDDTQGQHLDKIAYLDDIAVTQNFQAGEDIYRLVAVADSESNSFAFPTLPFSNGEKRLYYDLYATSFYYPDPDDPFDYEVDYSDYSDKQEVLLNGYQGITGIAADAPEGSGELFDLSGRPVADPVAGIYILRQGSQVKKIIIR